jgi:hypothetical protein
MQEGLVLQEGVENTENTTPLSEHAQERALPSKTVARELVAPGHPPAGETAAQEQAVEQEGVTQEVAVLRDGAENTEITTPLSKRARVSPAQEVSLLDADQTKAEASSSPDHDASVDQFINVLLNVNHATQKFMIIKLVSNIDRRRSIEDVLFRTMEG